MTEGVNTNAVLEISGLTIRFRGERGVVRAVNGVDLEVRPQQTMGLVGESGCGKSVTALSIMGLLQTSKARITGGHISFVTRDGNIIDLTSLDPRGRRMRAIRGSAISMVFQEPMTSLNPVQRVGKQIMESIVIHGGYTRAEARERTLDLLHRVGIPSPSQRFHEYPHRLSGGMRQRMMIAMALSCNPSLVIADEPTTALDVTIQAQVLDLLVKLREEFKTAVLFITHDLGVIANIADEVAVMYLGRIVETAPVREIYQRPLHPYTKGLLGSIPSLTDTSGKRLVPIPGTVPNPCEVITGCGFRTRCHLAGEVCTAQQPILADYGGNHRVACWFAG